MIKEIDQVLHSYENNWELSPKGQDQWFQSCFSKINLKKDVSIVEQIVLIKKFYKSDLSEQSFKDIFKDKIERMPSFISPLNYHKQLQDIEIKKIAFLITNLTNLNFQSSVLLCFRLFRLYSIDKWNYSTFMILLNDYDQKIKLDLIMKEKKVA